MLNLVNKTSGEYKVDLLDKLSRYYLTRNFDSSLIYAKLSLEAAVDDGGNRAYGVAYNCLGNSYYILKDYDNARKSYEKAYIYRLQIDDPLRTAYTLANLAYMYKGMKKMSEAINSALRALEMGKAANDYSFDGEMYLFLSNGYDYIRDLNRSLEYALKANHLYVQNNDTLGITESAVRIGLIHLSLGNFDLARDYMLKAQEMCANLDENIPTMYNIYNNLGIIFDELGEYNTSLEYYFKNIDLCQLIGNKEALSTTYNNIGFVYNRTGQYAKAIESYKKSIQILDNDLTDENVLNTYNNMANTCLKIGDREGAKRCAAVVENNLSIVKNALIFEDAFRLFGDIAMQNHDYKKAYEYSKLEKEYHDTIYNREKNRSALEMQIRFDTETKEREIEILKKDKEISQLEVQSQVVLQRVLFIIILLMILLVTFTVIIIRVIRRKNKLLAQNNVAFEQANERLKESEINLKEMNATKDKLFSIIAHDLKNPFSALKGFSELLEKEFDTFSMAEKKEYIGVINESADSLYKLLDNLLQWSRTQIGSITYTPEKFCIAKLIWQEVGLIKSTSEKKKITLNVDANDADMVFADKNTISSVVRNLLTNAVKFTSQGGFVEIRAGYQDDIDMVEVVVIDSGVGISNSDMGKLFVLDASFTTKGTANEPGTGLGLMLCKEFVENNGGKIWVVSQKGKGSEFHFTLPSME